nr:restin homolog isoform X2 [Physcomitrium patens]|eukprot:XP_024382265.1 restin homolog isoform X2 [Physcomitrella patens]
MANTTKTDIDQAEELIGRIPNHNDNVRPWQRSSNGEGYSEKSSRSEVRRFGYHERGISAQGLGVLEWKGGFLNGNKGLDESLERLDASGSNRSRKRIDNQPASAPVRSASAKVVNSTPPASLGMQQGAKENCEPFRLQMQPVREKADSTRMRVLEEENIEHSLQQRLENEIDVDGDDIWLNKRKVCVKGDEQEKSHNGHTFDGLSSPFHAYEHESFIERTSLESLNRTMTRLMNGDSPPQETGTSHTWSNRKKPMFTSASNSDSSTSQSSLPLSHYIQRLRDARRKKLTESGRNLHQFEAVELKVDGAIKDAGLSLKAECRDRQEPCKSASSSGLSLAILPPTSSTNGILKEKYRSLPPTHFGNRLKSQLYPSLVHSQMWNRITQSDSGPATPIQTSPGSQHLAAISGSGVMIEAIHLQDGEQLNQQSLRCSHDELGTGPLCRNNCESVHNDANNAKIADLQRVLGELKGSMESVKIWIEVEGEGWRNRVDRLEKDLEKVKEIDQTKSANYSVSLGTDNLEDLRLVVEKLRNDGKDMKSEIEGLRNIEKVMKVELGDLRTRLGKVQNETEKIERDWDAKLEEGARERLLIMEKVENLSQLYLGGLKEIRQDLDHVKLRCSDRSEEIESQWSDLKRKQKLIYEDSNASMPRQVLLDELDQFRCDIAELVDTERGLLKETLEKESRSIWCKVMDAYANNKSDMLNMMKLEIQKQLHSARENVLLMTDALERNLNELKLKFRHAQDGAEELKQIIISAEKQKEVAAQVAADATVSATKAREILTDMLVSTQSEITNVRHESLLFQEKLALEKDMAIAVASETRIASQKMQEERSAAIATFQEVRKQGQELQDTLEKESPKLLSTILEVQKERDTALQAAADATTSAMKAGEVLAEVLGSFNLEMAKARHINMQLQEGLEHERGLVTQHRQVVHNRFSEELEVALATYRHAMDLEVAKFKGFLQGVEKENLQQGTGLALVDLGDSVSKTEDKLRNLMETVEQLQDLTNTLDEEMKRFKQQEDEQTIKDWKANMTQLNQCSNMTCSTNLSKIVHNVEERVEECSLEQAELRKRLKRCESIQTDLVQSAGEVCSTMCTLEKTVNAFHPQYDTAVQVVNDLSSKVERMEKRIEDFNCNEKLAQEISRVYETKTESFKEMSVLTISLQELRRDLRELQDHVNNNDYHHGQGIAEIETRMVVMESTLSDIQNGEHSEKQERVTLNDTVDTLQRKMDMLKQNVASSGDLESRIDHVASTTFSNLQHLESKVERFSTGVQSALESAALADRKCGALGVEVVKVFRMLKAATASSNLDVGGSHWPRLPGDGSGYRGRSHSPPLRSATHRLQNASKSPPLGRKSTWSSSRVISSPLRRSGAPRTRHKSGVREKRRNQSSDLPKLEGWERDKHLTESEQDPNRRSPAKNDYWLKSYPRESQPFGFPGQALTVVGDRAPIDPYSMPDRRQQNLQKTNIRLEGGRIHVNVCRRSGTVTTSHYEKRADAIAVES